MNKDYQALLYFKDSSESKAINISIEDYIFRITYDNELLFLPIAESEFKLGGEANSFLIISGRDLTIFIRDSEIFNDIIPKSGKKSEELKNLKESFEKHKTNKKLTPLYIILFSFFFIGIIYVILSFSTFLLSQSFPLSWEKKIGDWSAPQIVGTKRVSDKEIVEPIEQIGKHLESFSQNKNYNFKFYIVKDNEVNAFALPGGHVIVNTGLIEKSDSYQEVAGVIAHELQHVYQRHGLEKIINRVGISFTIMMLLGDIGGVIDAIGGELISLKFSRNEESEADKLGLELMYKSGIEPQGMVDFFKKLESINKDMSNLPDFISTHPNTKQRINELEEMVKNKYHNPPNPKDFKFDWKKIKLKVKDL
jgi:Zn-dependent protease with chaperone function